MQGVRAGYTCLSDFCEITRVQYNANVVGRGKIRYKFDINVSVYDTNKTR